MRSFLVTAGLFAGVGATVRTLTEFEDAIARVSATTSASGSDLRAYSKLARDIGATTEFTAGQVANAEVQLAQAGLTLRESIAALPAVTDFATASALSLGQAADITTKILAAYRLEASDASRVTDVIVTAANNATTSQAELARALVVSIPAAKGLGVEFEELVAVQAELARVGLRAEKGGRALDAVIRALTRPTERAERVFEQFGLTLEQVSV
ncbi:MAG: phage tail tape measure protein, partial [Kofleriaceae bacterium]